MLDRKAEVSDIDTPGLGADNWRTVQGQLSGSKAKASDHADVDDGGHQMESPIPANGVAPTDIDLSRQPTHITPFHIADGYARTIKNFIQAPLLLHAFDLE